MFINFYPQQKYIRETFIIFLYLTLLTHISAYMNPKPNPYLNLRPTASQKFQHRRIQTELQDPSSNKINNQWSDVKNKPRVIQSMRYPYNSNGYYPSKLINKVNSKEHINKEQVVEQSAHNIKGVTKMGNNHRRTKTGIQQQNDNKSRFKLQQRKNYQPRNIYGSYQNLKTQGDVQDEQTQKQKLAQKQSRFNRMKLQFSKYQASTAGTTTPTALTSRSIQHKYAIQGIAGKGTFGVVYFGRVRLTGQKIAIKKVLQDKRYKNRELQILKMLNHSNLLKMKDHFFTTQSNQQQYLNVIMDYYPDNLYQIIKKKVLTPDLIKLFTYQILKGLNYLDSKSIAHRDIKPQNILVDLATKKIVICDFGSAKKLVKGQSNISYICSRCYRAPELIFGATQYNPKIDVWSLGCVIVQMINGQAPFLGDSQLDQLLEIIKILGTPQKKEIQEMNPEYNLKDYKKFPSIKPIPWQKILKSSDHLLIDLVKKILQYSPIKRLNAKQALQHPYFDDLKLQTLDKHKTQQNLEIDLNPSKITISQNNYTQKQQISEPKQETIDSNTAKAQIANLSNRIKKEKQQSILKNNDQSEKKQKKPNYNINIMNHTGDSNININIHNININPDSQRQLAWQKHRLVSTNTRNNLERLRKMKEQMINNVQQGDSTKMINHSRNPSHINQNNYSNNGSSKMVGHMRIRSDLRDHPNEGEQKIYLKQQQKPESYYGHRFQNN